MSIFILIVCGIISCACFWYGTKLIKLYLKVKRWEKITATVIKKEVLLRALSSASRAGYKPSVQYSYSYNLADYIGNKVFLIELIKGERGFLKRAAEKFLEKINPEIEIHVNPENPADSVIYCDGLFLYISILVMGVMSFLIGLGNLAEAIIYLK